MLKGGGAQTVLRVVLTQELEVLAIVMGRGGAQSFHPLKGGEQNVLPCLGGGGGAKSCGPAIFPFCSPLAPRN